MFWLIIIILFLILVAFALYCCACNTTPYDREVDDEQQMEYLRQYKESHGTLRNRKDSSIVICSKPISHLQNNNPGSILNIIHIHLISGTVINQTRPQLLRLCYSSEYHPPENARAGSEAGLSLW